VKINGKAKKRLLQQNEFVQQTKISTVGCMFFAKTAAPLTLLKLKARSGTKMGPKDADNPTVNYICSSVDL
jgi:hypothetical protein